VNTPPGGVALSEMGAVLINTVPTREILITGTGITAMVIWSLSEHPLAAVMV